MEAYTAFAKVYDKFMNNVPYKKWADFSDGIIRAIGISKADRNSEDALEQERNLVLDMGCGTGVLTRMMYDMGYDMIGVDISQEMLDEAREKSTDEKYSELLYICQDMCELDLYSTVGTVISTCDSVNYLLEDSEIESCFAGVSNYLYPGGLFVFDFNTIHKYRDVIGESTISEDSLDCTFIWDNYFDTEENINEYDLTLFIRDDESGLYAKESETHYQRGYEAVEIKDFLEKSGLTPLAFVDDTELERENIIDEIVSAKKSGKICNIGIDENSERIIVIARKDS